VELTKIPDWSGFEAELRAAVYKLGHSGKVLARHFALVTVDPETYEETDRLALVRATGTDRDINSSFWNALGFDHEHDCHPQGKHPEEIIYAFTIDLSTTPYRVEREDLPLGFDITEGLDCSEAIVIYDASKLRRVNENEYWFETTPLDAVLAVFTITEVDSD
jgi:hypothetical protein